jgi:iron complex outermembrane receptor protein
MPDSRFIDAAGKASSLLVLVAVQAALGQTPAPADPEDALQAIVITGTRVENRKALESVAPIDVVSGETLRNVGVPEVNQALASSVPSYDFPRPGLNDGTDTVRPATLRGLGPDETLVLVNGKRRHTAALVNVNGSIGRGAAAADLNTVPAAMLKSIEVLRDGASAQYGSDALAGVINVRLRDDRDRGEASVMYGVRDTTYDFIPGALPAGANWTVPDDRSRHLTDGETAMVSMWKGLSLGTDGFLTAAIEYKHQLRTERGGYDVRQQYALVNGQFDPREATFDRFNSWYGEPEIEQKTVFINTGYHLASGAKLYGWASGQHRDARSAGFWRRALDDRNNTAIYPDGFLPIIAPQVDDYSAAAGIQWALGEWEMDTSLVYGRNSMDFTIENTLNRSLGNNSKTQFDAGGFEYDQVVLNFSGVRGVDIGLASPLNVALGLEARNEGYSINAGEPDSYRNGGAVLPNGNPAPPGAQVFSGFRPENELDKSRTAVGAYADIEARFTPKLLASAAIRGEHYSDFGSNVSGKLAIRYDFTGAFALRGAVQNGFRAPSLQQQYFQTTSTNLIGTRLQDITTFPVNAPAAVALGAKPLDPEKSLNLSLGAVLRFDQLSVTIDAYRIGIDDRVVLSENLNSAAVQNFLTARGFAGVNGARFFINGVDTTTRGVDIAMNYPVQLGAGQLHLSLGANFNSTSVDRVPTTQPLAELNPAPVLFDRVNVLSYEDGTPENRFTALANWGHGGWGATFRATRYGEVFSPDTGATFASVVTTRPNDVVLQPRTLIDLEGRYTFAERYKLAIGAENVLDEYPTENTPGANSTGTQSFSNYSPFGRAGRFLYGRFSVEF